MPFCPIVISIKNAFPFSRFALKTRRKRVKFKGKVKKRTKKQEKKKKVVKSSLLFAKKLIECQCGYLYSLLR